MFRLPIEKLNDFFATIAAKESLYIPANARDGKAHYTKWADGIELSNQLNTVRSAKDFFFPQTTNICDFNKAATSEIEVIDNRTESEDFTVFGVRACDARSFTILDKVFLVDPIDSYYATRREHATILTLACTEPEESCFCGVFGIDATDPEGDAKCWMDESYLYITANTQKGEAFVESVKALLEECGSEQVENQQGAVKTILERLPFNDIDTSYFRKNTLLDIFGSDLWKKLSEACLGCGTCTFVCPTCQCYDIKDYDTGCGIKRYRTWDSCMYSDFTKMAHGNSRNSQVERFRQRFMHKLVYFPDNNNNEFGCVGCGRCVSKCPISMNIVKVVKAFGEVQ